MASKREEFAQLAGISAQDIRQGFDGLAAYYDRFNDWISLGLHRLWKRKMLRSSALSPHRIDKVLDLCCGSGDISLLWARYIKNEKAEVHALDFSAQMLAVFKEKLTSKRNALLQKKIFLYEQDASSLKNFPDSSFAAVSIGFGLRNIKDRSQALREMLRVLRPGAPLLVLDLGKIPFPLFRFLHRIYFENIVPYIGMLLHGSKESMYTYLPASARYYPDQAALCRELQQAGFAEIVYKNLLFGSAVIHIARKAPLPTSPGKKDAGT